MNLVGFIRRNFFSLRGHIMIYGVPSFVLLSTLGLLLNYEQGTLTASWAMYVVAVCATCGLAVGVIIWYAITLPFIFHGKKQLKR